jgi:hypothetical protein
MQSKLVSRLSPKPGLTRPQRPIPKDRVFSNHHCLEVVRRGSRYAWCYQYDGNGKVDVVLRSEHFTDTTMLAKALPHLL